MAARVAHHPADVAQLAELIAGAGARGERLAPARVPPLPRMGGHAPAGPNGRVVMQRGCVEPSLRPEIAGRLAARKAGNIAAIEADCAVTAKIGCAVQIGKAMDITVLHLAELLDWASGGPAPESLCPRGARA